MAKKSQSPLNVPAAARQRGETVQQVDAARKDLATYNASQSPKPRPAIPLGGTGNGGAGILSARGAGAGGGGGEGGGGGGAEVQSAVRRLLLPDSDPYREDQGRRVFAAPARVPQAAPAAQALMGVNGSGYNAGVMTTRARQRAMGQADSLGLDPQTRAAMQGQILQGDYDVTGRAAQAIAGVNPQALQRGGVQQALRQLLLEGGAEHAAKQAKDRARYSAVAAANTERAQGNSAQAIKLGMNPLSSERSLQAELRNRLIKSYPSASLADLQKRAAEGDVDAAQAIEGKPGPWAPGSPQLGVRAREQGREDAVLNQRYVQPAQARADGVVTAAQLRAQGVEAGQAAQILKAQIQQQTAIYKAQMEAAGIDQQTQGRLLSAYMRANAEAGGDVVPWSQFHSQATQMMGGGQRPMPPAGLPGGVSPVAPMQPGAGQLGAAPSRPLLAAQPPQVQQLLSAAMTPEEWARFDQMPPADQQAFLADVAAGRITP